jgi:hypothetical protein
MTTLEAQLADLEHGEAIADEALSRFGKLEELLRDIDFEAFWTEATKSERKVLVHDLIDEVRIYPDSISVQVAGSPPIVVMPEEVGLRVGSRSMVSESRYQQSPTGGYAPRTPGRIYDQSVASPSASKGLASSIEI